GVAVATPASRHPPPAGAVPALRAGGGDHLLVPGLRSGLRDDPGRAGRSDERPHLLHLAARLSLLGPRSGRRPDHAVRGRAPAHGRGGVPGPRAARVLRGRRVRARHRLAGHLALAALTAVTVTPYLWLLSTSLKERTAVFTPTPQWLPWPVNVGNYLELFQRAPFGLYLVNTLIVVSGILAVQLVTVTLAGYVFARRRFRGRDLLFGAFLLQMMIPIHATFVPNFLTLRTLD